MTSDLLGESYYRKAVTRLKVLELFLKEEDYSDVVREAQEIVELVLKGVLRKQGIEPPKIHDVGPLLIDHSQRLFQDRLPDIQQVADISKWLRKEREFAFYGDVDLIPTEEYSEEDARRAQSDATFVVEWARAFFV